MDKKLIEIYGEDILCYRLRTARQKKRMQYKNFDKHLIQLHKTQLMLWKKKRNLGWEPLIPPVQKGWKRFFVLRGDVARSKYADFFQGILNKINTYDWSHRKDFLVKQRRFGKKKYVVKRQRLLEPDEYHFRKLNFSEKEKCFFDIENRTSPGSKQSIRYYVFRDSWRFVLRVRPNLIDKIRVKDGELESQIELLKNYLERNDFENRLDKITRGNVYKWGKREELVRFREKELFKNKRLGDLLDAVKENN